MKELLENEILNTVHIKYGVTEYFELKGMLLKLKIDKPMDGIAGFISYEKDEKRIKIKTGRFLIKRLQLQSHITEDEVQKLANNLNFIMFGSEDLKIELVKGSDITDAYKQEFGAHSCMTGNCAEYTLLYEMNPDRFQMIKAKFNTLEARAIVHKLDNGKYFVDRIYTNSPATMNRFIYEYADKKDWGYSKNAGFYNVNSNDLKVSNILYEDGHVPYMDSLSTYEIVDCRTLNIGYGCYTGDLDSTSGYISGGNCESCGGNVDVDDQYCVNGDIYCDYCYNENFAYCEDCDSECHIEDTQFVDSKNICNHCLESNYTKCDECCEYVLDGDTNKTVGGCDVCDECVEQHGYLECSVCGELSNECTVVDETDDYCDYCLLNANPCECGTCHELTTSELSEMGNCESCVKDKDDAAQPELF